MFKLTLASFVNTALLHIIFFKFGSLTPATENPTNNGCTPDFINLTISDDLPTNDRSNKVQFFCNNWNSIRVYFRLKNTYDEHRFFSIEHASTGHLNFLILTINNALYINTWNTNVIVLREPYRNETLNIVPIRIDVKEVNDRPTILPKNLLTEVREDVPVGTIVANFSISDPDDGNFGDLQVGIETREDIDINEWFEVVKSSNDTIQIRTASVLDADEYWNSKNVIHDERRGPTFTFEVAVMDGGGLKDHSIIKIKIIDVGDIRPVCNHQTLKNKTHWTKKGAIVTTLDNFCHARNYISAVDYFQEVTYSLISESCNFSDCINTTFKRYTGFKNTTHDGHTCQRWDSQRPHRHKYNRTEIFPDISVSDAANYCRDPDEKVNGNAGYLWCYTTDPGVRWQYCDIHKCSGISDCFKTSSNRYNGFQNTTHEGHTCQRWDSQKPHTHKYNRAHMFPDISVSEAANYCRDPKGEGVPWCFTTDPKVKWQYCYILKCSSVFNISSNGRVQLQKEVSSNINDCTLSVRASDKAFPTLFRIFSLNIEFTKCLSDTDYENIQWDTGIPEQTTWNKCPAGYIGQVSRYCSKSGVYQDPMYNCTKSSIDTIYKKLIEDTNTGQVDIVEVLEDLSNATTDTEENSTLFIGDIVTVINTLTMIIDVVTVNTTNLENVTNAYLQTINNILDERTTQTWKVNINQTDSGADAVLKITDSFVEKILTTSKNITAEISKSNLYLKMGSVQSCSEALYFPEREKEGVPDWARPRKDKLLIHCDSTVESFSGIMYRNLSMIMPSFTNSTMSGGLQLNAPVISFTFHPSLKRQLVSPVEITFQLFNHSLDNARCSFWKDSKSEMSRGYWSDEGCRQKIVKKDKDAVVCVCNHLTNFALLMSPSSTSRSSSTKIDEDHNKALSVISIIGCIVSIICLVLTVAIHAFFWRLIKSVRSIIHMNLSCWLVVAYILFLAGINRTENKDVCTVMAVLLHLVFLIVFFGMLTEGCNLSYAVLKPLGTRKPGIPLMISSYVIAVIIVGVSMGVSQLHGYGTEQTKMADSTKGVKRTRKKISDSERKRRKVERNRGFVQSRIYLGSESSRWKTLKREINVKSDREVATFLIDSYRNRAIPASSSFVAIPGTSKMTSTPMQVQGKVRTPSLSEVSGKESSDDREGKALSGLEELSAGSTTELQSPEPAESAIIRSRKKTLSSSFVDPFQVSIAITTDEEDEEDVDDSEYEPSVLVTSILPTDIEKESEDVAYEEAEFGLEVIDLETDESDQSDTEDITEGISVVKSADECASLCNGIKCMAFLSQLKQLANMNVSACTTCNSRQLEMVEHFVGSAVYFKCVKMVMLLGNGAHNPC